MASFNSDKIGEIHRELHSHLPAEPALRVKALESLLVEKGMLSSDTIDNWLEAYSENVGPRNGAAVIAKSWMDSIFEQRLRKDAIGAFQEMGFTMPDDYQLAAVFNSPSVHNLIVCTLCSCYPTSLIGIAPGWYKSSEYRTRAVREPRSVLREFGVQLDEDVEVRVWDSNSERRYIVVPERPTGTDDWTHEQLSKLVTRNAMIGTQRVLSGTSEGA